MIRKLALALVLAALACGGGRRVWNVEGTVEEVQRDYRQVVIAHEDVPGLMPAMTMNFDVADATLLDTLVPGQRIRFELEFDGKSYRVLSADVIGAGAVGSGPRLADMVADRDPAPPFALTDQDGRAVSLESLRGKILLLDFVYTNCPGPCPIVTGAHVRAQRTLPEDVRERIWFVSVSLDPQRDTPAALRAYAERHGADLKSWSFLTGDRKTIETLLREYGVGTTPAGDGEIDHFVVTFLIDGEGRIAKRYVGMNHEAEKLARDLAALAAPPEPSSG